MGSEGTDNCDDWRGYYNYSITEQLYTAEEIGTAGTISSISFYYMGIAAKDLPITVYMANVDAEDLTSGISLADADQVFSGTLPVTTTAGWVTINLATPFDYDGTSNLLIGFIKDYLYYFSGQSWQCTATTTTMARCTQSDSAGPYTTSTVPGSAQTNRPNIQMEITPSGGPVCEKPETFEVSNVTANSATLTWTGGSGTYNVEYKGGTVADWTTYLTNTTSTSANLTGLTPGTAYQYRVQSVCGSDVSGWKSVSFSTMFGIPLVEGFGTAIPAGWAKYSGLLNADGTATISTTTYGWSFGTSNGVFDSHARVNIYGTSCNYWLVTPAVLMENNVQLTFDLALTAYSGTLGAPATTGTDDRFTVLITTNGGETWTTLRQWDNAGSEYVYNNITSTATGEFVAIDLSSYAGQNIAIAFYGESTVDNADNNLHIDNVSIDYIPACAKPTGLAASDVTAHTATISWTSDAAAWQVQLGEETPIDVTEPTYTFTGLAAETTFSAKVRANCDGAYSEWTNPVSFTTGIACPVPTSFATSNVGAHSVTLDWTSDASEWVVAYQAAADTTFSEVTVTEKPYVLEGLDAETSYTVKVKAVCGGIDGESQYTTTRSFTTTEACPAPGSLTVSNLTVTSATLTWTELGEGTSWFICLDGDEENLIETHETTYTFTELESETVHTAKVKSDCSTNWSSVVEFEPTAKLVIGSGTSTNSNVPTYTLYKYSFNQQIYTVEELGEAGVFESIDFYCSNAPSTSTRLIDIYMVHTDKDSFESTTDWITVSEADKVYSGSCLFTTGWNSFVFDNPFIYDGTHNVALIVDDNTGGYNGTNDFRVFNATAQALRVYSDGTNYNPSNPSSYTGVVLNVKNQIRILKGEMSDCMKPTNLAAANITAFDATLSWTENGESTAWVISYNDSTVNANTNPFTLTGLTPETSYIVKVRPDCDENLWSSEISFTTDVACHVPTNVTASGVTNKLATISWNGTSDSYSVQYRTAVVAKGVEEAVEWNEVITENSSVVLTGLYGDTEYEYRVKGICGEYESQWTAIGTFTTIDDCTIPSELSCIESYDRATLSWTGYQDSYAVHYRKVITPEVIDEDIYDFEDGTMQGWTSYDEDGDGNGWAISSTAHGGTKGVRAYYNGNAVPKNWLISPEITLSGTFSFWAMRSSSGTGEKFQVYVSTSGTDISNFTAITDVIDATSSWQLYEYDLSAYSGNGYVAIMHTAAVDQYFLYVDDITFTNITPGVYGNWNVTNTETSPLVITDLEENTMYEWKVQGVNCDGVGGNTEWSEMANFTTSQSWNNPATWTDDPEIPEGEIPTGQDVTITGNVIIPADCVGNAGEVTIEEGGSLTIEEGGELIHTNEVPVTFQMHVEGYDEVTRDDSNNAGYRLIASPVYASNTDPASIDIPEAMLEGDYDLYYFDQTAQDGLEWINQKDEANNFTTLELMKGYLYANTENVFVVFAGQTLPTNINVSVDLVYEEGHDFDGWNLVGNPYTAKAYVGGAFYKLNDNGDEVIPAELGEYIAPMKGFFVQASATGETCTISTTPQNNQGSLNINLSQANTLTDRAILNFGEGKTLGKFQLNPNHTKVYIPQDGKDYAMVSASNEGEMPVSFKAEKNGNYTLSFSNENVEFGYLRLIDNLTGVETDLLETSSYSFEAKTTDYESRFRLVFATGNSSDDSFAYFNNGNLVINNEGQATLQVVDVMGRILKSETINGSASINVNAAPGVYMLRLINGNDVKVQKVVIE